MSIRKISKLLIANRGEIACRIAETAKLLGCHTVGVYSDADRNALHVKLTDEAYNIGPPTVQESYLKIDKLINVAKRAQVDAIHPGYGFLSESVEFAQACIDANLIFIGPPVTAIRDMGIKNISKSIMSAAGVPVIKGYHGHDQSDARLLVEAENIGFPVMIKAVRGGGGKGMRIAMSRDQFQEQLFAARREALKSFNNDEMLIEQFIIDPRHVEVQIFGDHLGNYVYLWERDCSIQRRHQKILEEAPAPGLSSSLRQAIGQAAVAAARAVNYVGAGTVEFVMDNNQQFYFMEMNTRLQVEHPITEAITQTDLVKWQLVVAAGEALPLTRQDQIPLHGHAFEARIYAEDCTDPLQMMPAAGQLKFLSPPSGAVRYTHSGGAVRVDTGVVSGDEISVYYDPMIAKLAVWGETREVALNRLDQALSNYWIAGLPTNVAFLRRLIKHPNVQSGRVHTGFITEHIKDLRVPTPSQHLSHSTLLGVQLSAAIWTKLEPLVQAQSQPSADPLELPRDTIGFRVNLPYTRQFQFALDDNSSTTVHVTYPNAHGLHRYEISVVTDGNQNVDAMESCVFTKVTTLPLTAVESGLQNYEFQVEWGPKSTPVLGSSTLNCQLCTLTAVYDHETQRLHTFNHANGIHFVVKVLTTKAYPRDGSGVSSNSSQLHPEDQLACLSPMPGVIEQVFVTPGDSVTAGQALLTLIAMKMEYTVRAKIDARVEKIPIHPGETVANGQLLIQLGLGDK